MLNCRCLPPGSLHVLGHLDHLHRAISHLEWYEIDCMRYLASTFSQMQSINRFSMFLQYGVPRHFLEDLLRFEHRTSLFSCLCMSMSIPNSSGNMQNHGYLGCFHAASARENISGVCVIWSLFRGKILRSGRFEPRGGRFTYIRDKTPVFVQKW